MIELKTHFVFAGGVAEKDLAGQRRFVRVCLGQIENTDYVLIAEMNGEIAAIPWESHAVREEAIERARNAEWMEPEFQERLIAHIQRSKFYGVRK